MTNHMMLPKYTAEMPSFYLDHKSDTSISMTSLDIHVKFGDDEHTGTCSTACCDY